MSRIELSSSFKTVLNTDLKSEQLLMAAQIRRLQTEIEALVSNKVITKADFRSMSREAAKYTLTVMEKAAPILQGGGGVTSGGLVAGGPRLALVGKSKNPKRWRTVDVHYRYNKQSPTGPIGAMRKMPTAIYQSGNLRRSHRTFAFRKSRYMFVGPKVQGIGAGGSAFFHNSRAKSDGYYGGWVDKGTDAHTVRVWNIRTQKYMSYTVSGIRATNYRAKAIKRATPQAKKIMIRAFTARLPEFAEKAKHTAKATFTGRHARQYSETSRLWQD